MTPTALGWTSVLSLERRRGKHTSVVPGIAVDDWVVSLLYP
jgi:hypothetical protein